MNAQPKMIAGGAARIKPHGRISPQMKTVDPAFAVCEAYRSLLAARNQIEDDSEGERQWLRDMATKEAEMARLVPLSAGSAAALLGIVLDEMENSVLSADFISIVANVNTFLGQIADAPDLARSRAAFTPATRRGLEQLAEAAIDLLNEFDAPTEDLEPDPDFEDGNDAEFETVER